MFECFVKILRLAGPTILCISTAVKHNIDHRLGLVQGEHTHPTASVDGEIVWHSHASQAIYSRGRCICERSRASWMSFSQYCFDVIIHNFFNFHQINAGISLKIKWKLLCVCKGESWSFFVHKAPLPRWLWFFTLIGSCFIISSYPLLLSVLDIPNGLFIAGGKDLWLVLSVMLYWKPENAILEMLSFRFCGTIIRQNH